MKRNPTLDSKTLKALAKRGATISDPVKDTDGNRLTDKAKWEDSLAAQCEMAGLLVDRTVPDLVPGREFVFDLRVGIQSRSIAFRSVLVEVQGAIHSTVYAKGGGRRNRPSGHNTAAGITRDYIKIIEAQLAGWTVLPVTSAMVKDGRALRFIERALGVKT